MDRGAMETMLDQCLVDDNEFRPERWRRLDDPFTDWR
jgi:hypothetical protein